MKQFIFIFVFTVIMSGNVTASELITLMPQDSCSLKESRIPADRPGIAIQGEASNERSCSAYIQKDLFHKTFQFCGLSGFRSNHPATNEWCYVNYSTGKGDEYLFAWTKDRDMQCEFFCVLQP
ncbi:MAG: hypothetical protein JAZ02_20425 [Candidatus Thiodiazotropha endolucinida]|nr:hypothetical protein [Candidatus Thiodiazotropha endolucinida]